MQELTSFQQISLFKLVEFQGSQNREIVFRTFFSTSCQVVDNGILDKVIVEMPRETLELWSACGYIQLSHALSENFNGSTSERATFILRKEALDYVTFMKKPKFSSIFINFWRKLIDDIPSLIWGTLGGALAVIITKILGF